MASGLRHMAEVWLTRELTKAGITMYHSRERGVYTLS